jgi:hypothetical protein
MFKRIQPGNKGLVYLRVRLEGDKTTVIQVSDDMKMGDILSIVAKKKMLDLTHHRLMVTTNQQAEVEADLDKQFFFYSAKEIRIEDMWNPAGLDDDNVVHHEWLF